MTPRPLFLFDGQCVLCSTGVAFLMRHDRRGRIDFASAQSDLGRSLYAKFGVDPNATYLLVLGERALGDSSGYLELCSILGGWWRLLRISRAIPRGVRDRLYRLVARNRYRWFGTSAQCALLSPEQRRRLLS
ncbi:MAG: thiol-disulfide oxidoreductase DCC family protein [Sphingomicrobium sp.]|nr:DCC1-like thiol-disulfide oxidoreductase family protein [Sphingomonadales bacterium]